MTYEHTPGPWLVERRYSNGCEITPRIVCAPDEDRGCGWIADLIGAPYLGHKSTLANAAIIASAPDLLRQRDELRAACEALMSADHHDHFAVRMSDSELAAIEQIKLALANTKERP